MYDYKIFMITGMIILLADTLNIIVEVQKPSSFAAVANREMRASSSNSA